MNAWKFLAIFCALFSIGAVSETLELYQTQDPVVANERTFFVLMGLGMTTLFLFLTYVFWKKSLKQKIK